MGEQGDRRRKEGGDRVWGERGERRAQREEKGRRADKSSRPFPGRQLVFAALPHPTLDS